MPCPWPKCQSGMQRFGTSPIPTHSIGLALLKSDWRRALSIILRPRPGETAEAEAGRRAWLEERDLGKALQLMPRRMVAERCILEAYQKNFNSDSDMQNALHAVSARLLGNLIKCPIAGSPCRYQRTCVQCMSTHINHTCGMLSFRSALHATGSTQLWATWYLRRLPWEETN